MAPDTKYFLTLYFLAPYFFKKDWWHRWLDGHECEQLQSWWRRKLGVLQSTGLDTTGWLDWLTHTLWKHSPLPLPQHILEAYFKNSLSAVEEGVMCFWEYYLKTLSQPTKEEESLWFGRQGSIRALKEFGSAKNELIRHWVGPAVFTCLHPPSHPWLCQTLGGSQETFADKHTTTQRHKNIKLLSKPTLLVGSLSANCS